MLEIIEFESVYRDNFRTLNEEWLIKYFRIEDIDRKVLGNPEKYILDDGGFILFAIYENEIVGTCALINQGKYGFELSKMGTPLHHHQGEYEKDIVYVENTELGFDYLRDNLEKSIEMRRLLNRGLYFAIVDEADSVLIDEARTPMIMSQANDDPVDKYKQYAQIIQSLQASSKKKKVSK